MRMEDNLQAFMEGITNKILNIRGGKSYCGAISIAISVFLITGCCRISDSVSYPLLPPSPLTTIIQSGNYH